jgi:Rps23 Pro-64 3,4-dihydroxylase Tpa1-like proline 4-hydroxylase
VEIEIVPSSRKKVKKKQVPARKSTRARHRPQVSFESSQVIVVDNFLDEETFRQVLDYCGRAEYRNVHLPTVRKVWRVNDGSPLRGPTTYWESAAASHAKDDKRLFFPSGAEIDHFIKRLVKALPTGERLVGAPGKDWKDFTVAPWIYPAGSALSLHQDGYDYAGAYTFFAHQEWNIHWGGYLLVLDPATAPIDYDSILGAHASWIEDRNETRRTLTPGFAQCIFPKPNRLVFIAPDAQHVLSRVDTNAGLHPRISIAGFFRKQPNEAG